MKKIQMLAAVVAICAVANAICSIISAAEIEIEQPEWLPGEFEENINLTWSPKRPWNGEAVNITIRSNYSQEIERADIYYSYRTYEGVTRSGGGSFSRISKTEMYFVISGAYNLGGSRITFNVTAYDPLWNPLKSPTYSYEVYRNGSWRYDTFAENLDLDFSPKKPGYGERVRVTIRSKVANFSIQKAVLEGKVRMPGVAPQGFRINFNPLDQNQTAMEALLPPPGSAFFPGGTNITFQAIAWDAYYIGLASKFYAFEIALMPETSPHYLQPIIVVVIDYEARGGAGDYAEGAEVTISNYTWSYTNSTIRGIVCYPEGVPKGIYNVSVKYKGEAKSQVLVIPNPSKNYTLYFGFRFNPYGGFSFPLSKGPDPAQYIIVILGLILPLALIFAVYPSVKTKIERYKKSEKKGLARNGGSPGIGAFFARETKSPYYVRGLALFLLGLFGACFIPFYPWWMVLFVALVTGFIGLRYPYLSLLLLTIFVIAAAGYQCAEFGLAVLVFSIVVTTASLFDWKFGALVFFTVFIAKFGLPFVVPMFAVFFYSATLAIAVAVVSGLFIVFLVSAGTQPVFGYFVGATHRFSIFSFARPTPERFSMTDFINSLLAINTPNTNAMGSIISENLALSALPFIVLISWAFAFYLFSHCVSRIRDRHDFRSQLFALLPIGLLIVLPGIGSIACLSSTGRLPLDATGTAATVFLMLLGLVVAFVMMLFCLETKELFKDYFVSLQPPTVGTRIAEMRELPKTTFKMVGGLRDVKSDLHDSLIVPLLKPEIAQRYGVEPPRGIMLFGPPGCGKTLLMKALATELHVEMIAVKCSDIMSKWYGESESRIAGLFVEAKARRPCILFLDELDAIAKRRDMYAADDVTPRILSIILAELDGLEAATGIVVVGTTNKPEVVDPALLRPGRFDKIIYVPPPDYEERKEILNIHMAGKPLAPNIDINELSRRTERFSGADIANLVKEAATLAMKRTLSTGKAAVITMEDFNAVLPQIKPSITIRMKEDYERIKLDYERKMYEIERLERKEEVIKWQHVADMEELKTIFRDIVYYPLSSPQLVGQYRLKTSRALFLIGPLGCGKTLLTTATANEFNIQIVRTVGAELISAVPGQSETNVREIFARAKENAPALLFFDDIDGMFSIESLKTPEVSRAYMQFFIEMDKLRPEDRVIVIAATNRPRSVEPALLARFDRVEFVPPPEKDARKEIFRLHTQHIPGAETLDFNALAQQTEDYSGLDIVNVIEAAKLSALSDNIAQKTSPGITMTYMLKAIAKAKPSIDKSALKEMKSFVETFRTKGGG